jgi:MFS family permease
MVKFRKSDLNGKKNGFEFWQLFTVSILLSGTLAWFFVFDNYFNIVFANMGITSLLVAINRVIFFGTSAVSAIIGALFHKKMHSRLFLFSWILLGILATSAPLVLKGVYFSILLAILLGVALGLGFPLVAALVADYTRIENRCRISGLIMLETFIIASITIGIDAFLNYGIEGAIIASVLVRALSFLGMLLKPPNIDKREMSWKSIFTNKDVILYFIPWLLFNIACGLSALVYSSIENVDVRAVFAIAIPIQLAGTAIFSVVSGFIADRIGRKQPIIIGILIFGLSYLFLGFAQSELSFLLFLVTLGVAWGFLMVIYLSIPGDLTEKGQSSEKIYSVVTVLPLIAYMSLSLSPYIFKIDSPTFLSQILSIILFLSIIPITQAKDSLSEKKIKERKLKEHLEKVKKLVQDEEEPHD